MAGIVFKSARRRQQWPGGHPLLCCWTAPWPPWLPPMPPAAQSGELCSVPIPAPGSRGGEGGVPRTAQLRELRPKKGLAVPLREVAPHQKPGPGARPGSQGGRWPSVPSGRTQKEAHARRLLLAAEGSVWPEAVSGLGGGTGVRTGWAPSWEHHLPYWAPGHQGSEAVGAWL